MKKIFVIAGMLSAGVFYAQQDGSVGINTQPSGATLDVQISADAVKTEGQGIAVPRVTKQQLSEMTGTIAEGALVYVNTIGAANGTATARIENVTTANGVGFYYFDKTKWVKVGSKTFTARTGQTASSGYDWTDGNKGLVDFYEFTVYSSAITLPSPADHKGAIIYIRNYTGGTRNFGGADGIGTPKGVASLVATGAMTVWSDGTVWHNISGRQ